MFTCRPSLSNGVRKFGDPILANQRADVEDVDLLIAPHHGRKSGRSYEFLDVVRPQITFFGNANAEHLAYGAWQNRNLRIITNNQANCMVVDTNGDAMQIYVTNRNFAVKVNSETFYSEQFQAYYLGALAARPPRAA
jgi:beta-lactamase superfamily II metal-dependent hydrolase